MRYHGVNYDVGVQFSPGSLSRERLDPATVRYEMTTIAGDLGANAVRVSGEPPDRLELAGREAIRAGLTVFLSPWKIDAGEADLLPYLRECAEVAQRLRAEGGEVLFVLGCELSLFADGIIPGNGVYERVPWLVALRDGGAVEPSPDEVGRRLDGLVRRAVATVRAAFDGPLTYAAGVWEQIDWELFDLVGLDYYRQEHTDDEYAGGLRAAARHGKPVVVLEFGCCTYEGAQTRGGMGWLALDYDETTGERGAWVGGTPPVRSERVQADHLRDQLELFAAEEVTGAFVFTFVFPSMPHSDDPESDFDMASYSLVKSFPAGDPRSEAMPPWRPKESFRAVAEAYGRLAGR